MTSNKIPHRPGWGRTQREDAVFQSHSTPIFVGRKVVGKVVGNIFQKNIQKNHFLHTPPAIAFDISSLNDAQSAGASIVEVMDRGNGQVYSASISQIWLKGFRFNRGYGDQIALPMDEWICNECTAQLTMF